MATTTRGRRGVKTGGYVFGVVLAASVALAMSRVEAPSRVRPPAGPAEPPPLAITGVTVVDVARGALQRDRTVVVSGGRITALGAARSVRLPRGATRLDGQGQFLIPGLWDMHVHWGGAEQEAYLPVFTANGVTGMRIMWGGPQHLRWRQAAEAGTFAGPRLAVAGNLIDGPVSRWPGATRVSSAEDGRRGVQAARAEGYDSVKVYSTVPEEAYLAIITEARRVGLPVTGHVPAAVGAARASDLGQKSIEHLWDLPLACSRLEAQHRQAYVTELAGAPATEQLFIYLRHAVQAAESYDEARAAALFARFARNGTWQVPTLTVWHVGAQLGDRTAGPGLIADPRLKYLPPALQERWPAAVPLLAPKFAAGGGALRRHLLRLTGALQRVGVPLLAGTDAGNPYCYPGFSLHDELALLVEAGLSPLEALQTATRNPARFLGRERELGTVERGKLADLVLLAADPLADIRNTTKIAAVIAGGRLYSRAELDKMLAAVAAQTGAR